MTMNMRSFLIVMLLSTLLVGVMYEGFYKFMIAHDIQPDPALNQTYQNISAQLDDQYEWAKKFQNKTEGTGEKLTSTGGEASLWRTVWSIIKLPFEQLNTISTMLSLTFSHLPLPEWIYGSILAIIIIVVVTIVLTIATRSYKGW